MKSKSLVIGAVVVLSLFSARISRADACPAVAFASDCSVVITLDTNGVLSTAVTGGPYDGPWSIPNVISFAGDDQLVGVVNNNTSITIDNITLTGPGTGIGSGLFGFDGDGAGGSNCDNAGGATTGVFQFVGCTQSTAGPTGYEGPTSSFGNISADFSTGTVFFGPGVGPGQSTWFSLEAPPALNGVVPVGVNVVPEPCTMLLLGTGVAALYGRSRRRRKA